MITFSQNIINCLSAGNVEAFYLLRITNSAGAALYSTTTYFADISLNNAGTLTTYASDGLIISVEAPQLSSTVNRDQYRIILADPALQNASSVKDLVGKSLETRVGFVDPITRLPMLDVADTFIAYKGVIDSAAIAISSAELGEIKIVITGASPIVSLDQKNGIYLSDDSIRKRNAKDSCCEQLFTGSRTLVLKWGKA